MTARYVVAICGASGSLYGVRLLRALLSRPVEVHLLVSDAGRMVLRHETDYPGGPLDDWLASAPSGRHPRARLSEHAPGDLFAPPASGSYRHAGMVIAPCSMRTLSAVAVGLADDLVHRSADVCLKERRPLILMTRETPLNLVHIENMRRATAAGAVILPASPGFYFRPRTVEDLVDSVVARVLDQLGFENELAPRWGDSPPRNPG